MSAGVQEGMVVTHPNRGKAAVKATRTVVVLLLALTVAMIIIVGIGGGSGSQETMVLPVQYGFVVVYILMATFAIRWSRGSLPVASGLAVLLGIFALVGGSSWFHRDHSYFAASPLNPTLVGVITFAIVPVQLLLIIFAMRGFGQGWNVEVERPSAELQRRGLRSG